MEPHSGPMTERNAHRREAIMMAFLSVAFLLMSLWIISLPHSDGDTKGTIPDEWAFYSWSEIYMDGELTVPLSAVGGNFTTTIPIANSSSFMLFINTSMLDLSGDGLSNDLMVLVYNGDGEAVEKASIVLDGHDQLGVTDANGSLVQYHIGMGFHTVEAIWTTPMGQKIRAEAQVKSNGATGLYRIYALVQTRIMYVEGDEVTLRLTVTSYDVFGDPVEGALVRLGSEEIGVTDGAGMVESVVTRGVGEQQLSVEKAQERDMEGLFGCAVEDGGSPALANHWPPGFGYILGPLIVLGLEREIGLIVSVLMGVSVYIFARRHFGYHAALISTALALFAGIAIQMQYSCFMADYASAAFAFAGFTSLSEGYHLARAIGMKGGKDGDRSGHGGTTEHGERSGWRSSRRKQAFPEDIPDISSGVPRGTHTTTNLLLVAAALALLGGLLMSAAVTMRYSAVVLGLSPAVYLAIRTLGDNRKRKSAEEHRTGPGSGRRLDRKVFRREKEGISAYLPSRHAWISLALVAIPFTVGLLIFGTMLMEYNNDLFGGPFNSGYQMSNNVQVITTTNSTDADIPEPEQSFFEQYFDIQQKDFENMPRLATILFHVIPILFIAPLGLIYMRRNGAVSALLVWILVILVIYGTLNWVGGWPNDDTRTMEDMRYFLPIVPAAAILSGLVIAQLWSGGIPFKVLVVIVVVLLMLSGTMCAGYGIRGQLERASNGLGPAKPPPGSGDGTDAPRGSLPEDHGPVNTTIELLLESPDSFRDMTVLVSGARVTGEDPINHTFEITGAKTHQVLTVRLIGGGKLPAPGSRVSVIGQFLPHLYKSGLWEIAVDQKNGGKIIPDTVTRAQLPMRIFILGPHEGEEVPPLDRFTVGVGIGPEGAAAAWVRITLIVNGREVMTRDASQVEPQRFFAEFDLSDLGGNSVTFLGVALEEGGTIPVKDTVNITILATLPNMPTQTYNNDQLHAPPFKQDTGNEKKVLFHPERLLPVRILNVIALALIAGALGMKFKLDRKREGAEGTANDRETTPTLP